MTIKLIEGFDHYTTEDFAYDLKEVVNYSFVSGDASNHKILDTNTRFGYGKYFSTQWSGQYFQIACPSWFTTTAYISFAFKQGLSVSGLGAQLNIMDSTLSNIQGRLAFESGILMYRQNDGGTILAQSTNTIIADTWYWVEVKIVVDDSPNGAIQVKIDGADWIIADTLDTQTNGTGFGGFWFEGYANKSFCIDDLVIQDDSGDFLGDSRVETFTPTGDNTVTWDNSVDAGGPPTVTNASTIDEIPVSDTDYVYTATSGEEDLYDFNTITQNDVVHGISLKYRAKKSDTGARTMQSRTSEAVTATPIPDVQGGAENALATDWIWYSDVFETTDDGDPDAGTAWSQSLIEDATFGIKVTV